MRSDEIKSRFNLSNQTPIPDDIQRLIDDKNWFIENYTNTNKTLQDLADELSISQATMSVYLRKHEIEPKRYKDSAQERQVYNAIISRYSGEVIRNTRNLIPPQEIDIYIPEFKLGIEINGIYWHSFNAGGKDHMYHESKRLLCESQGILLLQFWDSEIIEKFDIIMSMIFSRMNLNTRIPARKTIIQEVSNDVKRKFLDENHIQGRCESSIDYGLFYNNELVSLMTFGKSRFSKVPYELLRFCNKKFHGVIGGAGKLLKHFINNHNDSVISYSDSRYSDGGLYKTLGFQLKTVNRPQYYYTKDYYNLESRMKYQKKYIKCLYPDIYDSSLTEFDNMLKIGYDRIYGCSIKTWIKEYTCQD
jgi:very-short-patch-repair endonuclease